MHPDNQLEQLEKTILQQAQTLVADQQQLALQQCEKVQAESTKRLQAWEARETQHAQETAEQAYRRQVQASELKMQAELDRLRWQIVQTVLDKLYTRLTQLCAQQDSYLSLLKQYLAYAIPLLDQQNAIVVEVNAQDYTWLEPQWIGIVQAIAPTTQSCTLLTSAQKFTGGFIVRDQANHVRIDNTFEGLINRLEDELYQVIVAQLFVSARPLRTT